MKRPRRPKLPWLDRQSTNRDSVILLGVGVVLPLVLGLLDRLGVFDTLPLAAWVGVAVATGLVIAAYQLGTRRPSASSMAPLEHYAEHVTDALDTLQRVLKGQIPPLKIGEFIQEGLFEPAHAVLTREGTRGDVRLSVIEPDEGRKNFEMNLALGHSVESRRKFSLPILGSFAGLVLNDAEVRWSNDTDEDNRFKPHPKARPGREYGSIVAVPLRTGAETYGVLVVIATEKNAFGQPEIGYIRQLASIIDVTRAIPSTESEWSVRPW